MKEYKVWDCKIVVASEPGVPDGFDAVPRRAAIDAIEEKGIEVISCFSGWGGELTDIEIEIIERHKKPTPINN